MNTRYLAAFLIQPYLFTMSGTGVGLAWQYQANVGKTVQAQLFHNGQAVATLDAANDQGLQSVQLPLPACGFDSGYTYQVTDQPSPVAIAPIPCKEDPGTTRFTFIADSQEGPDIAHEFATEMLKFPAVALLHGGDLVQDGSTFSEWVDYFNAMSPIGGSRTLMMAVGNHEYRGDATVPLWKRFFGVAAHDNHYVVELGHARVIVLNSCFTDDTTLVDDEVAFVTKELAQPADWKVVMFHHPPYANSIANNPLAPKKEWQIVQNRFVPLFETFGVDLVLNGHTHIYERSKKNNVNYLTAGPAGGKMGLDGATNPYSLLEQHVRTMTHFELDSKTLRAVSYDENGKQLDQFQLQH
jgi:hypothetical protein